MRLLRACDADIVDEHFAASCHAAGTEDEDVTTQGGTELVAKGDQGSGPNHHAPLRRV